jgi:hypothetical protein
LLAALLAAFTGVLLLLAGPLLAAALLLLAGLLLAATLLLLTGLLLFAALLLLSRCALAALLLTLLLIAALILLNIFVRISHLKYLILLKVDSVHLTTNSLITSREASPMRSHDRNPRTRQLHLLQSAPFHVSCNFSVKSCHPRPMADISLERS